jgi:hypothetical protein
MLHMHAKNINPINRYLKKKENRNIKKTNKCITARNFVFDICIQMADKILILENYYTARSETIKIYFRSKQTK